MPIPWIVGGIVVAAAAAVTAAVSSDSSSGSSSSDLRNKERELERARNRKETDSKKEELGAYSNRIINNLGKKYCQSNPDLLISKIEPFLRYSKVSDLDPFKLGLSINSPLMTMFGGANKEHVDQSAFIEIDPSIVESTEGYEQKSQLIAELELELVGLEQNLSFLEELNGEFK